MLDYNLEALQEFWPQQKKMLRDALVAGDLWDRSTGLSLIGYNDIPHATALFTRMTEEINQTLESSGFPEIGRYYVLNLEEDRLFVIVCHGSDLLQGMLLDPKHLNMGILFNVVIPKAQAAIQAML